MHNKHPSNISVLSSSLILGYFPYFSCIAHWLSTFLVHPHYTKIYNIHRLASWIEPYGNRPFQTSFPQPRSRSIPFTFIDRKVMNNTCFHIYSHHFESDRGKHLANNGCHVSKLSHKCLPFITKSTVPRKVEPIRR